MIGIQKQFSRRFALGLNTTFNPRDMYVGGMLRPSILFQPSEHVNAALFYQVGGGYYLEGLRGTGGTGGAGIYTGFGAEICPQIVGAHMICTSVSYDMGWVEPTVSRSVSGIRDNGWLFRDLINFSLTFAFSL